MRKIAFIFISFAFMLVSAPALAIYTLKIEDGGQSFTMMVDSSGNAKFEGLLPDGDIYYAARKSILYYQPKGDISVYALATKPLERNITAYNTHLHPQQGVERELGFETRQWDLSYNNVLCKSLHTSQKMAERLAFDMGDFNRMNLGIAYLLGDEIRGSCFYARLPQALGHSMGFPLREETLRSGYKPFVVVSVVEDVEKEKIEWFNPKFIKPFNEDIHIDLITSRLTMDSVSAYERTKLRLGDNKELHINALRNLVRADKNRIQIVTPPSYK